MISFSSGCVINLDDLGDYPDYFQVITKVTESIKANTIDWKSMGTLLDADIEDIQHIPEFKELMVLLTGNFKDIFGGLVTIFDAKKEMRAKFIILLLKMMRGYYTSYTMDEQQAAPILAILRQQLSEYTEYFSDFWLTISKFAPYVQKHDQLVSLFLSVVNEQKIFQSETMSLAYLKSVDKILRFRMFRQALLKALNFDVSHNQMKEQKLSDIAFKETPFLKYKLAFYVDKSGKLPQKQLKQLINFIASIKNSSSWIKKYIDTKTTQ